MRNKWLDQHERQPSEEAPLRIILCAGKKSETVEYLDIGERGSTSPSTSRTCHFARFCRKGFTERLSRPEAGSRPGPPSTSTTTNWRSPKPTARLNGSLPRSAAVGVESWLPIHFEVEGTHWAHGASVLDP